VRRSATIAAFVAAIAGLTACGGSGGSVSDLPAGWVEGGDDARELAQNAGDLASGDVEVEVVAVYFDEETADSGFATNVNVLTEEISGDLELAEYQDLTIDSLRAAGVGDIEEVGDVDIAGEDARVIDYLPPEGTPIQVRLRLAITIHDGTGYAFTLTAAQDTFDESTDDFDAILDSWTWE
jgi:hypothetical protein